MNKVNSGRKLVTNSLLPVFYTVLTVLYEWLGATQTLAIRLSTIKKKENFIFNDSWNDFSQNKITNSSYPIAKSNVLFSKFFAILSNFIGENFKWFNHCSIYKLLRNFKVISFEMNKYKLMNF